MSGRTRGGLGGTARGRLAAWPPLALAVAAVIVVVALVVGAADEEPAAGAAIGTTVPRLTVANSPHRDVAAYAGLGAWVDGFDFGPAYQQGGGAPPVSPRTIDDFAAHGVRTVFVQAARVDPRSPAGLVDRVLLAELLLRAHGRDLKVVAWYLPTFENVDADLRNLAQLDRFEVLGHRFDGIAIDIEATEQVPDVEERNRRVVDLSTRLRQALGDDAIGAIVLPPVQTERINQQYWPDFPWAELAPLYDVWMPMSYWTFRSEASGYNDGYTYNEESTRRLRNNLGDPNALVHGIGGIGDLVSAEDLDLFVQSLADTRSIGGSIYDWNVMLPETREALSQRFRSGLAAALPSPPPG